MEPVEQVSAHEAAKRLGISYYTVIARMNRHGVQVERTTTERLMTMDEYTALMAGWRPRVTLRRNASR